MSHESMPQLSKLQSWVGFFPGSVSYENIITVPLSFINFRQLILVCIYNCILVVFSDKTFLFPFQIQPDMHPKYSGASPSWR